MDTTHHTSHITQHNRGFTLIEVLVAVSIFTVSVVAMMSLLANSISDIGYAKKKIAAEYLAQEGIEYMRNLRDTYVLYDSQSAANGWALFLAKLNSASCDTACYFDDENLDYGEDEQAIVQADIVKECPGGVCLMLLYNSNGKYQYSAGVESGFIRKIQRENISANEVKISSTVSWAQGSGNYRIIHSESLYSWIE